MAKKGDLLEVKPDEIQMEPGGFSKIVLKNKAARAMAFKIKSNNVMYSLTPVTGFIDAGDSTEKGPGFKNECRLHIVSSVDYAEGETDPKKCFTGANNKAANSFVNISAGDGEQVVAPQEMISAKSGKKKKKGKVAPRFNVMPDELKFNEGVGEQQICLINKEKFPIAFKIRTTNADMYSADHVLGIIKAAEGLQILQGPAGSKQDRIHVLYTAEIKDETNPATSFKDKGTKPFSAYVLIKVVKEALPPKEKEKEKEKDVPLPQVVAPQPVSIPPPAPQPPPPPPPVKMESPPNRDYENLTLPAKLPDRGAAVSPGRPAVQPPPAPAAAPAINGGGEDLLKADTDVIEFPDTGGTHHLGFFNLSKQRIAFKIKSSDNKCFYVISVFGFVEPQKFGGIRVNRLAGPPKPDKIHVQYTADLVDQNDAAVNFRNPSAKIHNIVIPVEIKKMPRK